MINELGRNGKENADNKGFKNGFWESITLIHSELSEAVEDFRVGKMTTTLTESGKPVGLPSELADVAIRLFILAHELGIDLEAEIHQKMAYNVTRPYKHGGKSN